MVTGSPGVGAANVDDGDRGAGDPDGRGDVLDDDADGREERCCGGAVRSLDRLAALDGARGARGAVRRRWGGGGEDCEGGEGEELGEHGNCWGVLSVGGESS